MGSTLIAKTLHRKFSYDLQGRIGGAEETAKAVNILRASILTVTDTAEQRALTSQTWGRAHTTRFSGPVEELFRLPQIPVLERDGSAETIDVATENLGPAFRMVIKVNVSDSANPFEAFASVPGGNYHPTNTKPWQAEAFTWRDGGLRPMVGHLWR
jgi:hypothetical protein